MLCPTTPSCMQQEEEDVDLGAWLGLGIGGGGGVCSPKRSHGERRTSAVQFPRSGSGRDDETIIGHKQAVVIKNTAEKGARKRLKAIEDDPSPSEDADGAGARKKLRLSEEQSTLLEDTFRCHNILSHAQKHELARRVNLTPRQVEVWFQNRRARTKLKQTEVDRELLKRCCESLTDENQRLKLELIELQRSAAAAASRLHVQFTPAAAADTVTSKSCTGYSS